MNERQYMEEQNAIWHRMKEIVTVSEEENRDLTPEEQGNWDEANSDLTGLEARWERSKKLASFDEIDRRQLVATVETPEQTLEQRNAERDSEYGRVFDSWVRGGMEDLDREDRQLLIRNTYKLSKEEQAELRASATSPGSAGGYLIPPGYREIIIERMKAFGGLMAYATIINTSTGNPLQWPTNDDTGNVGSILAENTTASNVDFTFGTATLGAYMYNSGIVKASFQILQDSVFDLNTWLPDRLGVRIARKVAADLVNGTGSSQPLGIVTNATMTITGADTTSITYDNLIDLEHSLDPAYRQNCRFMFNDATLAVIRKIKDSQGHPLWVPVPVPGMAPTINGNQYFVDQAMAAPGASAKSILFGDFQRAFVIRHVLDMQMIRFSERYADALQTGFLAFTRLDSTLQDSNAVAGFQHHS
jgi:HK97 family phage major capsid protein